MKYFIGHSLEGDVGAWHTAITNTLAEKFNTWKIQEICPSHITIFSEFETENIEAVSKTIDTVLSNARTGKYSISAFNYFDDRVVFAKIDPDTETISLVQRLREQLEKIPDIPKDKYPRYRSISFVTKRNNCNLELRDNT